MTDKIKQARRELFENEYVQYRQYLKRNKDGSYNEEWVEARWLGFNAALDCVVIELPTCSASMFVTSREAIAAQAGVAMCIDAIESTNLGIKVK